MVISNGFSKNVTALSAAIESTISVVTSAVVCRSTPRDPHRARILKEEVLNCGFYGFLVHHRDRASVLQPKLIVIIFIIVTASENKRESFWS